ncbi:MAG: hypothetical protein Q9222_005186 [Ikaeria aurantiellina]
MPVHDEAGSGFACVLAVLEPCGANVVTGSPDPDVTDTKGEVVGRSDSAVVLESDLMEALTQSRSVQPYGRLVEEPAVFGLDVDGPGAGVTETLMHARSVQSPLPTMLEAAEVEVSPGVESDTVGPLCSVFEHPIPLHVDDVSWGKEVDELLDRDTVHPVPRFKQRLTHSRLVHVDAAALEELVVVGRGGPVTIGLPVVVLPALVDGPEMDGSVVPEVSKVLVKEVVQPEPSAKHTSRHKRSVHVVDAGIEELLLVGKGTPVIAGLVVVTGAKFEVVCTPGVVVLVRAIEQPAPRLRQRLTQRTSVHVLTVAEELVVVRLGIPVNTDEGEEDGGIGKDVVEGTTVNPEDRPGDDEVLLNDTVQPAPLLRQRLTHSNSVQTLVGVAEELVVARLDGPVIVGEL